MRPTRKYRIVHEPYLIEYLMGTYPPFSWETNVRLGVPHPELVELAITPEEERMLKLWTASCDAVVILPEEVHLIECFIRIIPGKLEALGIYERLFKITPRYEKHWGKKIVKILLTPIDSPFHEAMAAELGIRVVKYRPPWIEQYIGTLAKRHQRGFLSEVVIPKSTLEAAVPRDRRETW